MSKNSSGQNQFFEGAAWGEVVHLCRRICLLRATGHSVEAARLQSAELAHLLDAARTESDTNADIESHLRAIFAAEEERIANATVMAEVLVPMIVERLQAALAASSPALVQAEPGLGRAHPPEIASSEATGLPNPKSRIENSPPARAGAPTITDFIDDMLEQERAPPRPARLRRVS